MDLFEPYAHTIAALALWAIVVPVLAAVSTRGRSPQRAPCGKPVRDYADPVYRRERAFANAVEISGPFVAAAAAAILAGAPPFWTNLLASLFIAFRVAMAAVHVTSENQTARSAFWSLALLCVLGLALLALAGAFA